MSWKYEINEVGYVQKDEKEVTTLAAGGIYFRRVHKDGTNNDLYEKIEVDGERTYVTINELNTTMFKDLNLAQNFYANLNNIIKRTIKITVEVEDSNV